MPGCRSQQTVYVPALVNLTVIGLDFSPGSPELIDLAPV